MHFYYVFLLPQHRTNRLGVANSVALARRRAAHRVAFVAASPAAPSSVAMSGRSRLAKELKECARDPDPTIALAPDGENLFAWTATLMGPKDTPFETGTFVVKMRVPDSYPLAPPKARFATKIFHPNVHFKTGEICLDVLRTSGRPRGRCTACAAPSSPSCRARSRTRP